MSEWGRCKDTTFPRNASKNNKKLCLWMQKT
nr:MAG TPA: hypothetical protein [Caudoviricetes sp.]